MFRSTAIIRELHLSLAKVTLMLKQSVKLCIMRWCDSMLPRHLIIHNDVILPTVSVTLSRLKCKLPDDGHGPKHVGAILIQVLM
jgi:hypothetical protein